MAEVASAYVTLIPSAKGFARKAEGQLSPGMSRAGANAGDRASQGFGKRFGGGLKKFAKVGAAAVAVAGIAAGKFLYDATQKAGDLEETISKTNAIFGGKAGGSLERWAKGAAKELGQSQQTALDAAATFGVFGKAAGKSGMDLAKFAKQNTKLATDLASFHNTSPEEAIEAIGAAFRGETEPIRKYGVLLDDASMRQQAVKMGIIETTKEALKPQQKTLVAQALILKQTTDAQGDFAKTSGGLANQQRILKAQFENVQASIGRKLLPVMVKVAQWANDKLIPALMDLWNWLAPKLSPVIKSVAGFIKDLAERFRGSGEQTDKFKKALADAEPFFNLLRTAAKGVAVVFKSVLAPALRLIAENALPVMAKYLSLVGKAWTGLWNHFVQPALRFIIKGVAWLMDGWAKMLRALGKVPGFEWASKAADAMQNGADKARNLADGIKKIPPHKRVNITVSTPNLRAVSKELDWVARPRDARLTITEVYAASGRDTRGGLQARAHGGPVTGSTPYLVGEEGPELFVPRHSGQIIPNHRLGSGGGSITQNIYEVTDARATARESERRMRYAGVG